ncbi:MULTISPECIES: conjugal transfer protein TraC [Sinorhizobium]|uniref:conjugal transfer protein TraC n=1 Tax=Sinorhizobium TaxID=28105 RepID=UPI000BE9383B|nr:MULTISPECIES: conjugal transfer protein TraC [Sinorhizobium]PDT50608.1 conjugal transfer protein TraC [Sinorhizobium sp. NG07B]POH33891.1 conjugal transfer protein TraC [Sinorhizobium americanum]
MKKPAFRIRDEIAKLQEQLKLAETREAERIGRIALKAGFGEIEIEEGELQAAFEDVATRFRGGEARSTGGKRAAGAEESSMPATQNASGAAQGGVGEA